MAAWKNKRVKTPTILQMEAVECGAASLAMILAHYGRWVPLERLREECGVSRDGSKASNLLKAARKHGLIAQGFKKGMEDISDLALPMIIFWNFYHFLILEGIKGNKVYLNDPAMGQRVVTREEFDQSFTGVALTFKPGPDFKKGGTTHSLTEAIKKRLAGLRIAMTYVVLAGLLLVIPGLMIPAFSKIFVDNILIGRMDGWFRPLLIGMGLTVFLRSALTWLQAYYLLRLETKLSLTASVKFFRHIFRLPVNFFFQRFGGEIGNRVQINDKVAQLLSGDLATNALNAIMIIFYAALMFRYDVILTCMGICIALFNFLMLSSVSRKRKDLNQRLLQEDGKLMGTTMYGIQAIETLKATGAESDFFSQWSGHQAKALNTRQDLGLSNQFLTAVPPLLMALTNVAVLTAGGIRVMDGHLTMGMLVGFQSLMISFLNPVNQMVDLGGKIQEADGDMKRLDDVLLYPRDKQFSMPGDETKDDEEDIKLSGRMELKGITFGYSRLAPPLVEDFNLVLEPGSRVALVGGSGSGKSTIAKLVAGLYDPWKGSILFDGRQRARIPRNLLINSIAVVDQEIFLFDGSVYENLSMWDETLPRNKVVAAAKDACIHDDIAERVGGYDSAVDEGGGNFSGGQCQRLEIARALAINPGILILDEATSALDPNTEKIVDANIRRRGCTCLIIAHRLSTIRDCDEIVVLDRGKVTQRGTHEEMIKEDGPYARLIKAE